MSAEQSFASQVAARESGKGVGGNVKLALLESADEIFGFRQNLAMQGITGGDDISFAGGVTGPSATPQSSGVNQLDPF